MPRRAHLLAPLAVLPFGLCPAPAAHAQPQSPLAPAAAAPPAAPVRATNHWNLPATTPRLAISGYDPVAYFPEGGGRPIWGLQSISLEHRGVLYRFSSSANKALFEKDPDKYEPAHGGWCAWAMKDGDKVSVDPKSFLIRDGRLFLFYNGLLADTRSQWLRQGHAEQTARADAHWKRISGEPARHGPTLKSALDAQAADAIRRMPAAAVQVHADGIREVAESGIAEKALKVGDTAPDFTLPAADGTMVSLKTMLERGPVVVTWFRGGWCPYCNIQLRAYQEALPAMEAAGAQLIALSPMTPAATGAAAQKESLSFPVLSDAGSAVAGRYGIAYTLPTAVAAALEEGVQISKLNADATMRMPLAATYVIDRQGRIAYAFVEADYRTRAEPADILAALHAIK